jgi:hypothetical protein
MWVFNPYSTENNSDESETPVTDQFTKNRYILLAALPTDAESAIPVIVNGDASAKPRVETTNKFTSHKKSIEHGESNHKMSNVIINVSTEKVS